MFSIRKQTYVQKATSSVAFVILPPFKNTCHQNGQKELYLELKYIQIHFLLFILMTNISGRREYQYQRAVPLLVYYYYLCAGHEIAATYIRQLVGRYVSTFIYRQQKQYKRSPFYLQRKQHQRDGICIPCATLMLFSSSWPSLFLHELLRLFLDDILVTRDASYQQSEPPHPPPPAMKSCAVSIFVKKKQ